MDLNFLISELESRSNLKKDDILTLVDKKYSEMKELITKEGAVYLVAREMEIDLPENSEGRITIRNIVPGMRRVSILGRVFRVSKINEFKKSNGNTGRVSNVFIGDHTGFIRVPLWDEQVKLVEEGDISIGNIVQIINGLVRENNFGEVEISLGRFGAIIPVEDHVELPSVDDLSKMFLNILSERTEISNIVAGGNFEINGTVIQLFRGNFLFDVCPMCGNKVEINKCEEHGDVIPGHALVISLILDDGTGDLRCVLFREVAEKACGITATELSEFDAEKRYQIISEKLFGKEFILSGRIKKSRMYDNLEMMVNEFKDINPLEESKKLVDEIELIVGG
ncbi:MAG: hypothetical protein HYS62_01010 [Candidatus Aenigmarchaeota archaeon]|nr:hypothetical protein [Candidatus Aenigmarchaeota archaeon]